MSRGPGRIERAIEAIFDAEPENALTTEDLCIRIYGACKRSHRVSVTRAASNVLTRRRAWKFRGACRRRIYYRPHNLMSYGMAQVKADPWYDYPHNAMEEELRASLLRGGRNQYRMCPGGDWWQDVERGLSVASANVAQRSLR